jgi:hypothetical protein
VEEFMAINWALLELLTPEQALQKPEYLQLMPGAVIGYAFRIRKWCKDGLISFQSQPFPYPQFVKLSFFEPLPRSLHNFEC